MPTEHFFKNFGVVMGTVCVPFFVLIGFLNTTAGMEFWRDKWHRVQAWVTGTPKMAKTFSTNPEEVERTKRRSLSMTEAQAIRKAQIKQFKSSSASTLHEHNGKEASGSAAHQRPSVVSAVAVTDSDSGRGKEESHQIAVVGSTEKPETSEPSNGKSLSWWEKAIGRKKKGTEHHV